MIILRYFDSATLYYFFQERQIAAHKAILGASSEILFELFANEKTCSESSENSHPLTSNGYCPHCSHSDFQKETVIVTFQELKNLDECQMEQQGLETVKIGTKCTCWKASQFHVQFCGKNNQGKSVYSINLSFNIARLLVDFCYTGTVKPCDNRTKLLPATLTALSDAALCLGLSHLDLVVTATLKSDFEYVADLSQIFLLHRSQNIRKLYIDRENFSDVIFQVDDGLVHGHKILLSSGCDVMKAMFAGRFMESENKQASHCFVFFAKTIETLLRAFVVILIFPSSLYL